MMKKFDLSEFIEHKIYKKYEQIHAGWSSDLKYKLTDINNKEFLLRVSDISLINKKREDYHNIKRLSSLKLNIPRAVAFGTKDKKRAVYMILTWIKGSPLQNRVNHINPELQYKLGYKSGEILKKIHSINPRTQPTLSWSDKFNKKIDKKISNYKSCPLKIGQDKAFMNIINKYRSLLLNREQVIQHGDYHIGNMVIDDEMTLGVIDFNRMDIGDPWEEFNRIIWCAQASPAFATGRIDGYFSDQVPDDFFKLLALYIANNQLASIPWALEYGDNEVQTMLKQVEYVYKTYEGFTTIYPNWYKKR